MKAKYYLSKRYAVKDIDDLRLHLYRHKRSSGWAKKAYLFYQNVHPNVQRLISKLILSKAIELGESKYFLGRTFKNFIIKSVKLGYQIQQYRKQWIRTTTVEGETVDEILKHLFVADFVEIPHHFYDMDMLADDKYFQFFMAVGRGEKIWKWLAKLPFQLNNEEFYHFIDGKRAKKTSIWSSVYRATLKDLGIDVRQYKWLLPIIEYFHIKKTAHRRDLIVFLIKNFDTQNDEFNTTIEYLKELWKYNENWLWRLKNLDLSNYKKIEFQDKLIECLFAKYQVHSNASRLFKVTREEEFKWYLHLAQGLSVRSIPDFPFKLSKNEARYFLDYPNRNLFGAYFFSLSRVAGASAEQATYIADQLIKNRPNYKSVLVKIIRFLIKAFPNGHYLMTGIIRYILVRFNEDKQFKLKGRTANSIERDSVAFYKNWLKRSNRACNADNLHYVMCSIPYTVLLKELDTWIPRPMSNFYFQKDELRYEIYQINSVMELEAEGRVMRHCVATYANYCKTGEASIWSFSKYNAENRRRRILTIELRSNKIVQAKGTFNDGDISPEDYEILYQWTKQEKLELDTKKLNLHVA